MSVQAEITRLQNAKSSISAAITGKGVSVPSDTKLDGMAALIESIKSTEAGGSGGEMQVAEGSFTPSSYDIKNTPISITGLGFTPKLVIVKAAKTSRIAASDVAATGGLGLLMLTGGLYNSWAAIQKASNTYFSYGHTDKYGSPSYTYDLSVSDDGFTISTTATSGALSSVIKGIEYEYFAIG